MAEKLLTALFDELIGNNVRRSKYPREISYGDVVCVKDGLLKRYGIWTGDSFILYGRDKECLGIKLVHEESFENFMQNADHFAICEFPYKYGHPTEWEQPSPLSSVVMPQHKSWQIFTHAYKAQKYKLYSPSDTVRRARSKLGECAYPTSEHFVMWCKTGIAESHRLQKMREWWEMVIAY